MNIIIIFIILFNCFSIIFIIVLLCSSVLSIFLHYCFNDLIIRIRQPETLGSIKCHNFTGLGGRTLGVLLH